MIQKGELTDSTADIPELKDFLSSQTTSNSESRYISSTEGKKSDLSVHVRIGIGATVESKSNPTSEEEKMKSDVDYMDLGGSDMPSESQEVPVSKTSQEINPRRGI